MDRVKLYDKTYRIIPSKYPTINLFEDCVDPNELEALYELEALTNDRMRNEAGIISRVSVKDRVVGPGYSPIMASFTHLGPPSRFTDGSYGVYYAGLDLKTAIAESKYSQAKQISDTKEEPFTREMRVYVSKIQGDISDLVDLRKLESVHNPEDYAEPQRIGKELRKSHEYGLIYRSVRGENGHCIAAFRPPIMGSTKQSMHLRYHWDGIKINHVDKISNVL